VIGGKASALFRLQKAGFRVPPFFVIPPDEQLDEHVIRQRCARLARGSASATFAVRSSAQSEDGAARSYAGMFETFLFVGATEVTARVREVRESGATERVRVYDSSTDPSLRHMPAAIVQLMVESELSGVAFGRDPVDGEDRAVVVATYGLGSGVVSGDCDTDTYYVSRSMEIVERRITHKTTAHRRASTLAGVDTVAVKADRADAAALCDRALLEVVEVLRRVEAIFGGAQDIEWAVSDGVLYVLQARPVTTQNAVIWDNSNIAESYGGLVSPLTFSFAQYAYAGAYRQLMRVFGIDPKSIDANADALANMLGLVSGRMYYNLLNWYRLLALIPGFGVNRRLMEGMMGVRESLPPAVLHEIARRGKVRDVLGVTRMVAALLYRYMRVENDIQRFHRRVQSALSTSPRLQNLEPRSLIAEFSRLEAALLARWDAPLVNDFFAMVFYGLLHAMTSRWCDDAEGSLHNDLMCAAGDIVSTEPALIIARLAETVRGDEALLRAIEAGDTQIALAAIRSHREALDEYTTYLERFGDRCPNELKLESMTLHDDPRPLLQSISRVARQVATDSPKSDTARATRRRAESRVARALRTHPLKRLVFFFTLDQARRRIRDRENLRLERTHVFARVRKIMVEVGRRLCERGDLLSPRDVFYLELRELRDAVDRPAKFASLRERVEKRREQYADHGRLPAPPDRFVATGAVAPAPSPEQPGASDGSTRTGVGCCAGNVRARVRIIKDVCAPLKSGEILVAERTDPGWVVLFPAAAGILVERGSLLSHAAIVSREMGIPSVVGITGLTRWLQDGDLVEFDGSSGLVRRLETAPVP